MTSSGGGLRNDYWRIVVTAPLAAAMHLQMALEKFGEAVLCELTTAVNVRITAFAREQPHPAVLGMALALAAAVAGTPPPVPAIAPEPARDWLALNRETFQPFRVGRFFIRQGGDPVAAPAGTVPLIVDAGLAFGSGRHASTAGCLFALTEPAVTRTLARRRLNATRGRECGPLSPALPPQQTARVSSTPGSSVGELILDLGCGSGILAIAAAKVWHRPVIAADLDRVAIAVATDNARRNGVGSLVRSLVANTTKHPAIRRVQPFRLILANILARPLRQMAAALSRVSGTGTILVLAGFVADDTAAVASIYAGHGFRRLKAIETGGWTTLVLVRGRL